MAHYSMPRASRARGHVLVFAFLLAAVTYLDRICLSAAAPFMMADLHLTVLQMSAMFSAFTLAYSIFEIPSGWLGDTRGPRRVLTRIVLWWSAFTMLTEAARGFTSLASIRFLFGAGEAGAFPNIARSFSRWFPRSERGTANGVLFLGSRVGGMLSAPIALLLIELAWIEHDDNHRASAARTSATPWRLLLASRNLHAICAMYFAFGYGLYFYFTWLPTYLIRELGFSLLAGGFFAALPFVLAGMADLLGGWLTDRLARTHGLRVARCGLGFTAFLTCGAIAWLAIDPYRQIVAGRIIETS
jgi:MFS transporter, ACS family, glucarate transporter